MNEKEPYNNLFAVCCTQPTFSPQKRRKKYVIRPKQVPSL